MVPSAAITSVRVPSAGYPGSLYMQTPRCPSPSATAPQLPVPIEGPRNVFVNSTGFGTAMGRKGAHCGASDCVTATEGVPGSKQRASNGAFAEQSGGVVPASGALAGGRASGGPPAAPVPIEGSGAFGGASDGAGGRDPPHPTAADK